jgi:diaminohydroxyphosphoribosylaminopyrimidine deaminase/5-amino-6-(5-phosphoribosylamino)uracil reductase
MLTCRHNKPRRIAARIVIDPELRISLDSRLVRSAGRYPTIVACDHSRLPGKRATGLRRANVDLIGLHRDRTGNLNLKALLGELGQRGMTNILIEGGGHTLGVFYDAGLADEAVIFVAPRLIGGYEAVSPLAGRGPAKMDNLAEPRDVSVRRLGCDHVYHLLLTDPTAI